MSENPTSNLSEATADGDAETDDKLTLKEGWHVIHLYYQIDHSQWALYSDEEKLESKTDLTKLVQEIRSTENTQLLTFSVVTPKADIAFMLLCDCIHKANEFEKRLTQSLGPEILQPAYSYLSTTELSEYTTTREQYGETLKTDEDLAEDSPVFQTKMDEFDRRMKKYNADRLYPNMPDWPVMCFYNMNKRRGEQWNWFAMPFEERQPLMMGHARVGRTYAGRIRQLITGSTGLDEAEWGVTLFANNLQEIKEIVYEMRFDEVSSRYGDFGDFFIGLQLPLDQLFRRVVL